MFYLVSIGYAGELRKISLTIVPPYDRVAVTHISFVRRYKQPKMASADF